MPFVPNTPESLLARSDSKNPDSTCRGITSAGRPCRRPVGSQQSNNLSPIYDRATTPDLSDESLYCWQHKEQASHSTRSSPGPKGAMRSIPECRTSLDTLADRLGLVDLEKEKKQGRSTQQHQRPRYPEGFNADSRRDSAKAKRKPNHRPHNKQKPPSKLQFCCFTVPIEEVPEKPRPRPVVQRIESAPMPSSKQYPQLASTVKAKPLLLRAESHTARLKNVIPDDVDAVTASALMAELARPYTDAEEPGYIYMFWLTPESQTSHAPVEEARSLLSPITSQSPASGRRASDAVSRFAAGQSPSTPSRRPGQSQSADSHPKQSMLLKIGRAVNVQRRMNQWQRQCGYDVEVLRYYPQTTASGGNGAAADSSDGIPLQTPHCRRIERLVHIELAGLGLRAALQSCGVCGRDHREWFSVDASRDGIRRVDAAIRRWVDWDMAASS